MRVGDDGQGGAALRQQVGEGESGRGVVQDDCLSGLDQFEGSVGDRLLLRLMLSGPVFDACLDEAGRHGGDATAGLAQDALGGEGIEVPVNRHDADAETIGELFDTHGPGTKHELGDGVVSVTLVEVFRALGTGHALVHPPFRSALRSGWTVPRRIRRSRYRE